MNSKSRALLAVLALVGAVVCAMPGVSAAEGGGGDDDGEGRGEKVCQRVGGLKPCVAVLHGSCTLWVSAGVGGCLIGDGKEFAWHAAS